MHTHLARIAKKRAESASKRAELDDAPHLPCDTCVEVASGSWFWDGYVNTYQFAFLFISV